MGDVPTIVGVVVLVLCLVGMAWWDITHMED